ncbi:DegT/DnrJ/EryC1/StrS family aminotransferase [Mesobacillus zeae]|uniref:DegT/DnrJ/EryC1/StrS family aminotransferase n=1 Tax=Mesobacillus zeae TaxID=1917180 RepID=A0A398AWW1_9BACI|nr:DegT/DnrJ/EryC1/StrS family aminotransferase [Mesobacillus zeae]RID82147.1 DegT/DnrJ/EryC1/StrS family aminotransferase [Mesobacillus zeae]
MNPQLIFEQAVPVTKPKLPKYANYTETIKGIWNRRWLTNDGPLHQEFKTKLERTLKVPFAELFTNGHLALEIAIKSLGLKGEVITTPFTFASTIHAISNCGLTPVFCDIDRETLNIDPDEIEKHITSETSAIAAVHVFGTPCNVYKIEKIAQKHGLKVIYDAAHAFGVELDGKGIGNFGDISMFSLHATKVFHSIEGGLLTFSDDSFSPKLKALKNFGITSPESVDYIGTNAKMNEFQAAMGLCNLEELQADIAAREAAYQAYVSVFQEMDSVRFLQGYSNIKANYSYFPVLFESKNVRDQMFEILKKYNVLARKYFYPLCNDFSCYNADSSNTPVAKEVSDSVLCLPMFSDLGDVKARQIAEIINYELGDKIGG